MTLTLQAYAKINLTLEALAKRSDGYHEIRSILQTISLSDTISFQHAESIEFSCDIPALQSSDNLVLRALNALKDASGCDKGVSIKLSKMIPTASGLGSGSTDAATTLTGLNILWELNLPLSRLAELAAGLGSDIPFFLYGGTCLVKGRGEDVTALNVLPKIWMVLLKPPIEPVSGKTAKLYAKLDQTHFTSGLITYRFMHHLQHKKQVDDLLLFNVFEKVAFTFFDRLPYYRSLMLAAGAVNVHLAGSGPVLFTLARDKGEGESILNKLEAEGLEAYLVHTIGTAPLATSGEQQC